MMPSCAVISEVDEQVVCLVFDPHGRGVVNYALLLIFSLHDDGALCHDSEARHTDLPIGGIFSRPMLA